MKSRSAICAPVFHPNHASVVRILPSQPHNTIRLSRIVCLLPQTCRSLICYFVKGRPRQIFYVLPTTNHSPHCFSQLLRTAHTTYKNAPSNISFLFRRRITAPLHGFVVFSTLFSASIIHIWDSFALGDLRFTLFFCYLRLTQIIADGLVL